MVSVCLFPLNSLITEGSVVQERPCMYCTGICDVSKGFKRFDCCPIKFDPCTKRFGQVLSSAKFRNIGSFNTQAELGRRTQMFSPQSQEISPRSVTIWT